MISFMNYVYQAFKDYCQVHVIYIDFTKVFDSVNYNVLVIILKAFNIGKFLLSWFKNFLSNCMQCSKLFDYKFDFFLASSGVSLSLFVNSVSTAIYYVLQIT